MLKIKFMSLFMRLAPKIYPKAGLPLSEIYWQLWYQFMSKADKQRQLLFLNYGFVDLDPNHPKIELKDADEPNRFCIQMYHKVASAIDLKGLDVLEIACGRGGGGGLHH